jgi:hypothetical protein
MEIKMRKKLLCLTILLVSLDLFAQTTWGPYQTDYRRDLWQYQSQVYSHGLGQINTLYLVGRESGPKIWRDVYQWDIPDEEIPDYSTINSVQLEFDYSDGSSSSDLFANFYKITSDMIGEDHFIEIFQAMDYTINPIGSKTGTNHHITFTSSDPNAAFNMAIKDMLPNNKFVLGIKWGNDAYNN